MFSFLKDIGVSNRKTCPERLVDVFVSKCRDSKQNPFGSEGPSGPTDCYTTITIENIAECNTGSFPTDEEVKEITRRLQKLKGLRNVSYIEIDRTENNYPYLAIRTLAYDPNQT